METMETIILKNLIQNEDYTRRVVPFLDEEYFKDRNERIVYTIIRDHIHKYNRSPNRDALIIALDDRGGMTEQSYKDTSIIIKSITDTVDPVDNEWLMDKTEKFCKDKAIYNAIVEGISIIDGKDKKRTPDAIPDILMDALGVSFDDSVGHDYLLDSDDRYTYYHKVEERIPFDLEYFNRITKGGLPPKTLNVALAGTGVGKSLFMCHMAANCLSQGKNVLYITLEMAE